MEDTFHRQHHIKGLVRQWQGTGISLFEFDGVAGGWFHDVTRPYQLPLIEINAHQIHALIIFINMGNCPAKSAAHIQHA